MKVIAITSGKGGAGKSCVTAYTGASLATNGAKVLLIEQGIRSLDLILGAQDRVVYDIQDVAAGKCEVHEAIQPSSIAPNLFLLAGGIHQAHTPAGTVVAPMMTLGKILDSPAVSASDYDFVLLDDVELETLNPRMVQTVLIVTTPDTLSVRACTWRVQELLKQGYGNLRLIINNVPSQVLPIQNAQDFDDVIDLIGAQLIAVIPASPKLQFSSNNAEPLSNESLVPEVFDNLSARLQGENRLLLVR